MIRLDHVVLLLTQGAVLWAEEGADVEAGREQRVGCVTKVRRDRSRMDDEADTGVAQVGGFAIDEALESGAYGWLRHGREDSESVGLLPAQRPSCPPLGRLAPWMVGDPVLRRHLSMKLHYFLILAIMATALTACDTGTAPIMVFQ